MCINDCFHMEDSISAVLTFMTYEKPEVIEDGVSEKGTVIVKIGDLGRLYANRIKEVKIETCPITDSRLKKAWKHDCLRILLFVEQDKAKTIIR